jgi:hypothetical protein
MSAFAAELRACLDGGSESPTQVIPSAVRRRTQKRRKTWPLRNVVIAVLFGAAALVAGLVLGGGTGGGPSAGSTPVHVRGVTSYDPKGQEQQFFGRTAPNATDGNPATAWQTQTYNTTAFGGLKDGFGLVLASPGSVALKSLTVTTSTPGFVAEIESGTSQSGPFVVDSASRTVGGKTTFKLDGNSGSYWLVWLTQLGPQRTAAITNVTAKK